MNTHYMDEAQGCYKMGLVWQDKIMADGTSSQATRQTETKSLEDAFPALSRGQEAS
jgi:ABC-type multidrug transport system ATPase subunit